MSTSDCNRDARLPRKTVSAVSSKQQDVLVRLVTVKKLASDPKKNIELNSTYTYLFSGHRSVLCFATRIICDIIPPHHSSIGCSVKLHKVLTLKSATEKYFKKRQYGKSSNRCDLAKELLPNVAEITL
jgi:hypothetical protein